MAANSTPAQGQMLPVRSHARVINQTTDRRPPHRARKPCHRASRHHSPRFFIAATSAQMAANSTPAQGQMIQVRSQARVRKLTPR